MASLWRAGSGGDDIEIAETGAVLLIRDSPLPAPSWQEAKLATEAFNMTSARRPRWRRPPASTCDWGSGGVAMRSWPSAADQRHPKTRLIPSSETPLSSSSSPPPPATPPLFSLQHPPAELPTSPARVHSSSGQDLRSFSPFTVSESTIYECCAPRQAQASTKFRKMGLSKSQRICILLGIDSVFFVIELVVGMQCCRHCRNPKFLAG
jgi:hypothetical protein